MPSKLRLSASEWRFALTSFAAKVGLFWLSELVICQWDQERWICNVVGKGFYPLPDHIRTNGSSGDPTDQALKKPLKFKILA